MVIFSESKDRRRHTALTAPTPQKAQTIFCSSAANTTCKDTSSYSYSSAKHSPKSSSSPTKKPSATPSTISARLNHPPQASMESTKHSFDLCLITPSSLDSSDQDLPPLSSTTDSLSSMSCDTSSSEAKGNSQPSRIPLSSTHPKNPAKNPAPTTQATGHMPHTENP